jgi:hypothetical protein
MQAKIPASLSRILTCVVPVLFLAGCFGEGDGPKRIPGTPAPPPPPDGFCDVINFEVACEPFEFVNFAGGEAVIIDNPDKSGLNTTDRVARMQKFDPQNGETFGGTKLFLDGPVDFSEGEAFTMKVWASRSVPVLFKLEPGALLERTRSHSGSGEWEELCFDFAGAGTAGARTELTLIFDLGVTGQAATDPDNWTFFFDEITQVENCDGVVEPGPVNLPVNFEGAPESYDFGQENGFAGGVATVIANPDRSGLNTTAQTARMQKFAGEVFGGATLVLDDLIDFGKGQAFNMKVWSGRSVPVLFKLEDAVSGLPELGKESTLNHSGSGTWEQLCFDFTGNVAGFSSRSITFIFDLGVLGDAENNPADWTFYFDEITQVASCGGDGAAPGIIPDAVVYASDPSVTVDLPPPVVDDLGSGSTFDFFFTGDADFNPALRVRSGGDTGGGVEGNLVINGGFETGTFDGWQRFENNGVLAIVTDNPASGTYAANLLVPVRGPGDLPADPLIKNANLQAGNLTPGASVTVSFDMRGTLSGAGGVVFAELFSELAGEGVSKAEILSGGPLAPTAGWTTYSFTTTLGPDVGGGVTLQLKASCGQVEGCGVDVVVDNASIVLGTGTASVVNGAGDLSLMGATGDVSTVNATGANIGLIALTGYEPGFAAGFETFDFKVKGLPTGTIEVRFIEGGDTSRVYDVNTYAGSTELGNGWYQLSIPLTDFAATIASNQGFVLGPLGEQAAPFAFLLTDIGFSGTAGGGGTEPVSLSVNFEAAPESYDFGQEAGFAGGVATVIANPDRSGLNTTAQTARMQKFPGEVFGGATLVLSDPIDFDAGEAFTMKVWASRSVPVLFKLEDAVSGLPELGKESTATHSGSGSWEEVCFDFSGELAGFSSNSITFIFDLGVLGDAANNPDDWTFYFDEITQVAGCDGGGGGGGEVGDNIVINGGFETGTFDGWETFPGGAIQAIVTDNPSSGTYAANLAVPVRGPTDAGVDNFIKNSNLEAGNLTPGAAVTVSFDMRGTLSGAGGVVFAELFSEQAGGGASKSDLLSGGPLAPTAGWTTYSFPATLGPDVSGGVTLQLKASCGPVEGCGVDVFFDNVSIVVGGDIEPPPPGDGVAIDFDGAGPFNFIDFEGGVATVVANPDQSGLNTSAQVARMQKFEGAPFAGSTLPLASAVDFSAGPAFTMKVWSARPVPVTFKLEGLGLERVANHTGGSVWQELCFDFTGFTAGAPTGITFIFDNGVVGDAQNDPANWTFYFDAIEQVSGCTAEPPPPTADFPTITFDDPEVTYTLTPFGGNASVVTNDPAGGTNMVAQVLKPNNAEVWAGTTVSTLADFAVPAIPFTASETRMTVRVYSPDAGIPVMLKVEVAANAALFVEALATTTVANEWETLTFDFATGSPALNLANTYNKVSIFFNFGFTGAGEKIYFLDDIAFEGDAGGGGGEVDGNFVINGGFETGTFEGWETIPGGGLQAIVTDNPSSGTYAANLVVPVRTQSDPAVDNLLKNSNLEAGNLTPGAVVTVSFDMRGTLSGAGGVVFAELFSELAGSGTSKSEILGGGGPLAPTPGWTSYSFTTTLGPDVGGGVTLQLKASCGPVAGCGVDVFFDNVSIVSGEGDGGGGGGGGGDGGAGEWDGGGIVINGGFETGTFDGWETFAGGGIQAIVIDNPSAGTYAANLVVPVRTQADPAVDNLIKNSNLEAGNLTPGASVTVSFDMRGTLSGAGGVVFAELFSELSGGGTSKSEIFTGGPLTPAATWTKYTFNTTLGPDVSGGVTLQLKTSCGPVEGCGVDVFLDNVSIVIN